ncbi:MAG: M3 family metallopeptidase [Tenuifilaceae bacterium]|nr:M3 family metallopeptidase [Bacteroidales bacterium]MDI9517682.1 M3 family metallopeptidase [Bacteroidota bacterium]NLH57508.1 M3 family metallopeptidase [Rikenellaceae bacterium]HNV81960.1 M3 family metallopeptidase [Tenuifilaceae bacterium]HOF91889.1 M3 family metallopeptidase [Tenuifilaceae bacterium]
MKKFVMFTVSIGFCLSMASCKKDANPLLSPFDTPFGIPPFEKIKVEHFEPAFAEAMKQQKAEIEAILTDENEPTFENTILPFEYSGRLLINVANIFFPLTSANTSPELQAVAQTIAPMLSSHMDDINLNPKLFQRIKSVYEKKDELDLNAEQQMLLSRIYNEFVRGGANLPEEKQQRFREINEKLSTLTLKFGDNVLAETNGFQMVIDDAKDLAGLPDAIVAAAAESATACGKDGKWVFTLHNPSWIPFLQYAENRDLRENLFRGYFMRGNNNNEYDNKEIIKEIVALRLERAQLLGYKSHAQFVLEDNMAKTPETVNDFLMKLWGPSINRAKAEAYDIQKMIDEEESKFKLASWDWWYYTEKIRKAKYDLDEEMLKPYFPLENVKKGIFLLTEKLYGLKYEKLSDVPIYHPEAEAYEVKGADNQHIGILFMDFHPRESKRGGAWMTSYRDQYITRDGEFITPIVTLVCNFTRPSGDTPALLSLDEASTFFHEFGHGLHGLLSKVTYPRLAGTNVPRDFVELPSQIMENWCTDPEFLKMYAFHYQTGEPMPDDLIKKMEATETFNQGFITTEYLAAAILDMMYHTIESDGVQDVMAFEKDAMQKIGLIDEIIPRYRSTYYQHIFSGGYSSSYYSYIWSGVLDSDAYQAFKETGNIFDPATANRFREFVLEKGSTEKADVLYRKFRGADPNPEALLKKRGLM